jgi:tetratricopeptide (TPR) repeat protein
MFEGLLSSPEVLGAMALGLMVLVFLLATNMSNQNAANNGNMTGPQGSGVKEEPDFDSKSFFKLINKANQHMEKGQLETALATFNEALLLKGDDPALLFKIGRLHLQRESPDTALRYFNQVLSINPDHLEAYYELARTYLMMGSYDKAHKVLDQLLEISPNHNDAKKLRLKILVKQQRYDLALPVLQKMIERDDTRFEYRQLYAECLEKTANTADAMEQYSKLAAADPANAPIYHSKMGNLYFESEQFAEAVSYLKKCLNEGDTSCLSEADLNLVKGQLGAALCNQGVGFFEDGLYREAINQYQEALIYDVENPDIHFNLGKAFALNGENDPAFEHFETSLKLNPRDVTTAYELAILHDARGSLRTAITYYELCLEMQPQFAKAAYGLGTLYGIKGDYDKAIECLSLAVKTNPNFTDAFYNMGVTLEKMKNYNKALQMYKKTLQVDKQHIEAQSNLAHLKTRLKSGELK